MVEEYIDLIDESKDRMENISSDKDKIELYKKVERETIEDEVIYTGTLVKVFVESGYIMARTRLFFLIPFCILLAIILTNALSSLFLPNTLFEDIMLPVFLLYLGNTAIFPILSSKFFLRRFSNLESSIIDNIGRDLLEEKRQIEEKLESEIFHDK